MMDKRHTVGLIAVAVITAFIFGINVGAYPPSPVDPPSTSNSNITTSKAVIPRWIEVEQLNASWIRSPMPAESTYVVATSNSVNKEHANYICDGTNDQVEINNALDNCSVLKGHTTVREGGTVVLMDGIYNISSPIEFMWDNTELVVGSGAELRATGSNTVVKASGRDNILLRGNGLVNCSTFTSGGVYVDHDGIYFDAVTNSTIEGITVFDYNGEYNTGTLITLQNGENNTVSNCVAYGCISGKNIELLNDEYSTINNCHVYGGWWGIDVYKTSYARVSSCEATNNGYGISVRGSSPYSYYCKIYDNIASGNDAKGFDIRGYYHDVSDNTAILNGETGIYATDLYHSCIDGNIAYNNSVSSSDSYANIELNGRDNNTITDNICRGGGTAKYGIWINSGDNNVVKDNDVREGGETANIGNDVSTSVVYRNQGYTTGNSGIATITSGNTSVTVNHGLDVTPVQGDIMVTANDSLASASYFWVDTFTSTQFTIHVDADPTQDVTFAWRAATE